MAKFSSLIIASHQSAMNFSTLMYAFPMSISSAMAIVVSYELGAKRFQDAKKFIHINIITQILIKNSERTLTIFSEDILSSIYTYVNRGLIYTNSKISYKQ